MLAIWAASGCRLCSPSRCLTAEAEKAMVCSPLSSASRTSCSGEALLLSFAPACRYTLRARSRVLLTQETAHTTAACVQPAQHVHGNHSKLNQCLQRTKGWVVKAKDALLSPWQWEWVAQPKQKQRR